MKRIIALTALMALGLTACGTNLTVATPEDVEAYPDAIGIMESWQGMLDAANSEDCEAFQAYARNEVGMAEGDCEDAFAYMADAPAIDWSKTQWDGTMGKGKIYELDKGGLSGFILNESDDVWRFDTAFWSN